MGLGQYGAGYGQKGLRSGLGGLGSYGNQYGIGGHTAGQYGAGKYGTYGQQNSLLGNRKDRSSLYSPRFNQKG